MGRLTATVFGFHIAASPIFGGVELGALASKSAMIFLQRASHLIRHGEDDEIISPNVANESLRVGGLREDDARSFANHIIAFHKTINIVIGLKGIQVEIEHGERSFDLDTCKISCFDRDISGEARQGVGLQTQRVRRRSVRIRAINPPFRRAWSGNRRPLTPGPSPYCLIPA